MTFTRARHNPLSLVILNERRFCASEGPRRAARTGGPHHARLWRDGVGDASRPLRGTTRALGTLPYHPPARCPRTDNLPVLAKPRAEWKGNFKVRARNLLLSVPAIHAPTRNSKIRHHPQPLHGRNNDREHLPPSPPQQMPRLPIALPPRELALNIRIEPQILASRKRLHRNHIPHITRLNVHHQRVNLLRRISRLPSHGSRSVFRAPLRCIEEHSGAGCVENTSPLAPGIRQHVCRIFEGGEAAFQKRERRYALSQGTR